MESEERPSKMRKLAHGGESVVEGIEQIPAEKEVGIPHNGTHQNESPRPSDKETAVPLSSTSAPDKIHRKSQGQNGDNHPTDPSENHASEALRDPAAPKLSKNQLKKQARQARWESGRENRKIKRKEKAQEKKQRKREAYAELRAKGEPTEHLQSRTGRREQPSGILVPITVIFDCGFDDLMHETELKSLGLQITRCYSDNRKAPYRFHMAVSSFGGKLKERFDGILAKQYTSWKGIQFSEEDFVKVSENATEWMKGRKGGQVAGALKRNDSIEGENLEPAQEVSGDEEKPTKESGTEHESRAHPAAEEEDSEVVYLSAESDVTLERLKPNSTYIIGGLVDKNRHKGICYQRAKNRGIKTAKLPIGEFLQMKSRQVLVTNHVLEIMLKWLELGDWGKAFLDVLPKRKEAMLKDGGETPDAPSIRSDMIEEENDGNDDAFDIEDDVQAPQGGEASTMPGTLTDGNENVWAA